MSRTREDGFALITTLWLVALLALVTVVIEGWIASSLAKATGLQQRVNSDVALIGASDRVVFLMLKGGWSPRGLELVPRTATDSANRLGTLGAGADAPYIALDGRPYRLGDVTVRLQDEGGLFDLSNPDRNGLARLLGGYGIPPSSAELMINALIDYEKPLSNRQPVADDDKDYALHGLPPPRHTPLLTPWEPYRVLGWLPRSALWQGWPSLADLVTIGPVGGIDVNTAPAKVLAAVTGADEREAARVVAARLMQPITDIRDLPGGPTAIAGTEDRPLSLAPSSIIRLEMTAPGEPLAHIVSVRLTSLGIAPYRIDYAVALPHPPRATAELPLPLPEPAVVLAPQ